MNFRTAILVLLILILPLSGIAEECIECAKSDLVNGECFEVEGSLKFYNGWPPYIRIETRNSDTIYGVGPIEDEYIPDSIKSVLPTTIEGKFKLCPFNETTSVPYEDRIIKMVCIKSVSDAWYLDKDTGEKKKLKQGVTN